LFSWKIYIRSQHYRKHGVIAQLGTLPTQVGRACSLLYTSPIITFPHDLRCQMCNSCNLCVLQMHCRIRDGLIARHAGSVSVSMTYRIRVDY
jgi:hypothetical protein